MDYGIHRKATTERNRPDNGCATTRICEVTLPLRVHSLCVQCNKLVKRTSGFLSGRQDSICS